MPHEIEEKVAFRHGYHFVGDFHEQAEALVRPQRQPLRNVRAKVLRARRRIHLERLVRVVGKEHFVKYLGRFVLYRLDLYLVRRVLPLAVPNSLLQTL